MQVQVGRGLLHAPLTLNARKARRVVVVNNDGTSLETLLNLKSNHSFREALQVNETLACEIAPIEKSDRFAAELVNLS